MNSKLFITNEEITDSGEKYGHTGVVEFELPTGTRMFELWKTF
jgi:hypothetical protein